MVYRSLLTALPLLLASCGPPPGGGSTTTDGENTSSSEGATASETTASGTTASGTTGTTGTTDASDTDTVGNPAWPADLVVRSDERDPSMLWAVNVGAGESAPFGAYAGATVRAVSFAPAGDRLAVVVDESLEIFALDGAERTVLGDADSLGFWVNSLAWSPSGDTIAAIVHPRNVPDFVDSLELIDPEDGSVTWLSNLADLTEGPPVWSPAGDQVAFWILDGEDYNVLIHEIPGTDSWALDPTPGIERDPAWSPDAERLAFASDRTGECAIYIHEFETALSTMVSEPWAGDCRPWLAWSPGSGLLAYARENPREIRAFTPGLDDEFTLVAPWFPVGELRWSPSGVVLAYSEASDPTPVVSILGLDGAPSFSLDGSHFSPRWRPGVDW